MSIPKNHHYVSQCHIKEFFNTVENAIYIYDKKLNNYYSKQSTKHLFSQNFLNSKEINGTVNHTQLETELKYLIEDDFPKHLSIVKKFIKSQEEIENAYLSLNFLTLLGVIGELRNPIYKYSIDASIDMLNSNALDHISYYDNTKYDNTELKEHLNKELSKKHKNIKSYIDIAFKILDSISPLDFSIYMIESSDHFLLPDTSCFRIRKWGDIGEVIQIGIPISDKIFILCTPRKINISPSIIKIIDDDNSDIVFQINKDLTNFAYKAVVCSDRSFLEKTIAQIKGIR